MPRQEYTLAHLEPPDSLEAAEAGIRKFEDFLMSMENNRDKVLSPVDSGNKLVAEGNLYADKIREKVQLIEDRYSPCLGPWLEPGMLCGDTGTALGWLHFRFLLQVHEE